MAGSYRRKGIVSVRAESVDFTRRVYMPVQRFIHTELVGSVLLLAAAVAAVAWANSPWAHTYAEFWHQYVTVDLVFLSVKMDLHHWINDGLMALFFFVVGLEIKREVVHGNLSDPRQAALPAAAAIGGMVVPALVYAAFNGSGEAAAGWGIPMATDIAFALGVLGLLGRRLPSELRVFLLALAIVDDIGAILVIALFYTESVSATALMVAGALLGVVWLLQRVGFRNPTLYFLVGGLVWLAVFESGVHATIAGVILGIMTPSKPYVDPDLYKERMARLMDHFDRAREAGDDSSEQGVLGQMEELTQWTESPVEKLERMVHPWTAYLILPLFALANAGVALSGESVAAALGSTVLLGIVGGLIVGKLVGVTLVAWIAVKMGVASLPAGVRWAHVSGVALLAGIGFTVSLFITGLAFTDPAIVDQAKIAILLASLLAGGLGYGTLRMVSSEPEGAQ
jgi:NhaA family Na+:H+ antiporter